MSPRDSGHFPGSVAHGVVRWDGRWWIVRDSDGHELGASAAADTPEARSMRSARAAVASCLSEGRTVRLAMAGACSYFWGAQ